MKIVIPIKRSNYIVVRGGYWGNYPSFLQASYRYNSYPTSRYNYFGFRIVRKK